MGLVAWRYSLLLLLPLYLLSVVPLVISGDAEALLALKSAIDPLGKLQWPQGNGDGVCQWPGVKQCMNGRVSKLVLEFLNLRGTLDGKVLNQLDQLRVLSFKGNSISGQIPDISSLVNLKTLYLNQNNFSGELPSSNISGLHRLKIVVLAENELSGEIPETLLNVRRLYTLYLQDNKFSGQIPPFKQTSLKFFNVSNNQLSGEIPETPVLLKFKDSSFLGNIDLCGDQVGKPCNNTTSSGPPPSIGPISEKKPSSSRWNHRLIMIIAGTVGGFLVLVLFLILFCLLCKRKQAIDEERRDKRVVRVEGGGEATSSGGGGGDTGGGTGKKEGEFSWEGEGVGSLVFLGAGYQQMSYSMEDLLKASAETLGRGTVGSTYKAVMESGYIVTVKRLKDARYPRLDEFRIQMDLLGRLRHPNIVPLRAYFQAKEERLLVYDYFPNGNLFTLIHGPRTSGGGKPLHWTSCLKIGEDLATGLLYIHQNHGIAHGNLKSSNVLLGSDFESCLTDYCLTSFRDPNPQDEAIPSASSLFYRAPECRDMRGPLTQQADIYSFGVLLLELLTGKTPFQDLVQEHGADIPAWVRSVREEETESGDDPASSGNEASEEKLQALLNIAMACVCIVPENRPTMRDVLKMVRDARAEAQISSNSSDHSPGRWSDTVLSLPRGEHSSI